MDAKSSTRYILGSAQFVLRILSDPVDKVDDKHVVNGLARIAAVDHVVCCIVGFRLSTQIRCHTYDVEDVIGLVVEVQWTAWGNRKAIYSELESSMKQNHKLFSPT